MKYKIIDFHTHPYADMDTNICRYKDKFTFSPEEYKKQMQNLGIEKVCGSVLNPAVKTSNWEDVKSLNDTAQKLKNELGDFYIVGNQIHPHYVKESIATIKGMRKRGEVLIGEIVPSALGCAYADQGFEDILSTASGLIFSFHSTVAGEKEHKAIERLIARYKDVTFVGAHPGETDFVEVHLSRMKKYDNYYLDVSGTGIFRQGMLAHVISEVGSDRILFGSDFPTCNPAMFVGGVACDCLISEKDKENVLYNNAKRLLKL